MDAETQNNYLIILCGGTGPRLWPLSRADHPKQFLKIFGDDSLLVQTIKRSLSIVDPSHIFIVSNQKYNQELLNETKGLIQPSQIIEEPEKKNTATAILYASSLIYKQNPNAVIASLPSDQYINPESEYINDLHKAFDIAATSENIVTLGVTPTFPSPSYGYILPSIPKSDSKVISFCEKPDTTKASELIKGGAYWNSGIYVFKVSSLVRELESINKEYFSIFNQLLNNLGDNQKIQDIYNQSSNLAFDVVVSEKSSHLFVHPINFSWSDVGEWKSIHRLSSKDPEDNTQLNRSQYISLDSKDNLISISSLKLAGIIGVENTAIIETDDAILICNLDSSFSVRDLVTKITDNPQTQNYFLLSPSKNKNDN